MQRPANHIRGIGCPKCNQSKLENQIEKLLKENNIEYIEQHTFNWLKNKRELPLDFYLPQYNIAIECQGRQHFEAIKHFNNEEGFRKTQVNDLIKHDLCKENGVKLLYFSNLDKYDSFLNEKLYKNEEELLKEIIS